MVTMYKTGSHVIKTKKTRQANDVKLQKWLWYTLEKTALDILLKQ